MSLIFLIKDIILNDFVLYQSLIDLRWYGLFKFFHIIIKFIATKQDLALDYYAYNWTKNLILKKITTDFK